MNMRPTLPLLVIASAFVVACAGGGPLPASGVSGADVRGPGPAAGLGLSPASAGKNERKHQAMKGLDYSSGRAVRVPEDAAGVLAAAGSPTVASSLAAGHRALQANLAIDAIKGFTRAVLLEGEAADHYHHLGLALRAIKLESEARAAWETGHELDPTHVELSFRTADMAYRFDDRERAIALFGQTVELDPNHGPSWGRLARIWYFDGADQKAWDAIHRADDLAESIPSVMRARLSARTPDPRRQTR